MVAQFVDRLTPLAIAGDLSGARLLVASLDDHQRTEAAEWLTHCRGWLHTTRRQISEAPYSEERHDAWSTLPWIIAMAAVELCGPATAAKVVPWGDLWGHRADLAQQFTDMLMAKPSKWALAFLEASDQSGTGGSGSTFTEIIRTVGRHHGAPCPTSPGFYGSWLSGCPEADFCERIANDPWMPDLLVHYLGNGGADSWVLECIPNWIQQGAITREQLVGSCLTQLATPRRPGSQNMLAKVARMLDFRADEVPGGLDYLLGLIATLSGPAGRILLPAAIELVNDDTDAQQLAAVIAARTEKAQKSMLVTALTTTWTDRISPAAAVAALTLFVDDPDTAFAEKVRTQLRLIAPTASAPEPESAVTLGLWDLSPTPASAADKQKFPQGYRIGWPSFLTGQGRAKDIEQATFVDRLLTAVTEADEDELRSFTSAVRQLMDGQELTLSRITNLLPDLFLGGGMKQLWAVALDIADYAAWRSSTPPTLADLLRQLTSFAAEAPAQPLPYNLAALAARPGTSKAQVEARVLADALGHPGESLPDPIAVARDVWRSDPPTVTLPEDLTLKVHDWGVDTLAEIAALDYFSYEASMYPMKLLPADDPARRRPHFWIPDQALAAAVRRIHCGEAAPLREKLQHIRRRHYPHAVWIAIFLWARGRLDVPLFWRLATDVQPYHGHFSHPSPERDEFDKLTDPSGLLATIDHDEHLLLPQELSDVDSHLAFLRACEALLLADRQQVVLAEPVFADGTVSLDVLVARLNDGGAAPWGPLDVVQALYRLRDGDPSRVDEIPLGRWFTAAELTSPDGSAAPMDVGGLIRTWLNGGGLPPLDLHPEADYQPWVSWAQPPVSWTVCPAAPSALSTLPRTHASRGTLRTYPGWVDLTADYADFSDGARGPLGLYTHSLLLAIICDPDKAGDEVLYRRILDQFRAGRIDPELFATASMLPVERRAGHRFSTLDAVTSLFVRLFTDNAMPPAWSVALATALRSCEQDAPWPLPNLVELLVRYAVHVPPPRATTEQLAQLRTSAAAATSPDRDTAAKARAAARLLTALEQA